MPLDIATHEEELAKIQADFVELLEGCDPYTDGTVEFALSHVIANAVRSNNQAALWAVAQFFARTADEDYLLAQAAEFGIFRKPAVKAGADDIVKMTGMSGAVIPAGHELRRSDGAVFVVDAEATISGGEALLDVTAKEGGAAGNTSAGTVLRLASPIVNVDSEGTVQAGGITGGSDIEPLEQLTDRLLFRKANPPGGGLLTDFVAWAREVPGVTRAWAYQHHLGLGTIGLTFVRDGDGSGANIIPSAAEVTSVSDYIAELAPPFGQVEVYAPSANLLAPEISGLVIKSGAVEASVQAAMQAAFNDFIYRTAQPAHASDPSLGVIYRTALIQALAAAPGHVNHSLDTPAADVTPAAGEIVIADDIVWS